jgi:hypothetical protein
MQALADDNEPQKRPREKQSHSRSLTLDTEYREEIPSLQATSDAETNRLLTLVAHTLARCFKVARTIDEQALCTGLDCLTEEFARFLAVRQCKSASRNCSPAVQLCSLDIGQNDHPIP